jgi:hypothetical protein
MRAATTKPKLAGETILPLVNGSHTAAANTSTAAASNGQPGPDPGAGGGPPARTPGASPPAPQFSTANSQRPRSAAGISSATPSAPSSMPISRTPIPTAESGQQQQRHPPAAIRTDVAPAQTPQPLMFGSPVRTNPVDANRLMADLRLFVPAIQKSSPEAVRQGIRDNWEKCILGSDYHLAFLVSRSCRLFCSALPLLLFSNILHFLRCLCCCEVTVFLVISSMNCLHISLYSVMVRMWAAIVIVVGREHAETRPPQ